MSQIFVTPEGKSVQVADEHAEEAQKQGLEPAMVMADHNGRSSIVKASHLRQAQQAGLVPQQEWDIKQSNRKDLDPGALESAGRGFANAATLGFADEIAGAGEAVKGAGKKLLSGKLPSGQDILGGYERGRNEYRNVDDAAWANNKLAYGAGAVAPALLTGGADVAQLGIGKAALQGAAQGAIGSLGGGTDVEGQADLTKGEFGKAALQTGLGTALGGGLAAGTAKIAPKVAEWLSELSNSRAAKAIGSEAIKAQKNIDRLPGGQQAFGKEVQDLGIVSGLKGTKGMLTKAKEAESAAGKIIGNTYEELDRLAPTGLADSTLNKAIQRMDEAVTPLQERAGTRGWSKPVVDYVSELKTDLANRQQSGKPFTIKELQQYKRDLDQLSFPESGNTNQVKEIMQGLRSIFKDAMIEDASELAQKAGRPELIENLAKANRNYSVSTTAKKALTDKAQREAKNRSMSLTDYITGGALGAAGAASLGPAGLGLALAGAGANKLGRTYGNQAIASTASGISNVIHNNPQLLNYLAAKTGVSVEELLRGN